MRHDENDSPPLSVSRTKGSPNRWACNHGEALAALEDGLANWFKENG